MVNVAQMNFEDQVMTEEVKPSEPPFYLMRPPPDEDKPNGSTNLILHNEKQQAFKQYCCKKVKEPLSAFLPDFPGSIDNIDDEVKTASTLGSILQQNIVKKEIHPFSASQLSSFRLYPGALPDIYMSMVQANPPTASEEGSSKKPKKSKKSSEKEKDKDKDEHGEKRKKKKDKKKKKKSSGND